MLEDTMGENSFRDQNQTVDTYLGDPQEPNRTDGNGRWRTRSSNGRRRRQNIDVLLGKMGGAEAFGRQH
jgi:hypothetical protein